MRRWLSLCFILLLLVMGTACGRVIEKESKSLDTTPSNFYEVLGTAKFKYLNTNSVSIKETYGNLDGYGRPTYAFTKLTHENYIKEKKIPRQEIKVDPIGWVKPNPKVVLSDGSNIYTGYLYNRSHLLADSLGGDPIKENLITGTRLQNVGWNKAGQEGGMGYGETLARNWLDKNKGYIFYEVYCHYEGSNKISDYQIVNILSSDGSINKQIKVYNGTGNVFVEYIK